MHRVSSLWYLDGMTPPKVLQVLLDSGHTLEVPVFANANGEAREMMMTGLRMWDEKTKTATFYPPHRIALVEGKWSD